MSQCGNIVPPHSNYTGGITATIKYAVAVLEVKHIIVCGHTCCGAMQGVMDPDALTNLPQVTQWLSYSKAAHQIVMEKLPAATDEERLAMLLDENVLLQLQHLKLVLTLQPN